MTNTLTVTLASPMLALVLVSTVPTAALDTTGVSTKPAS